MRLNRTPEELVRTLNSAKVYVNHVLRLVISVLKEGMCWGCSVVNIHKLIVFTCATLILVVPP